MKKSLTLFLLLFSVSFYAQNEIKITPNKCIPKKGYYLRLKSVFDDSRCPENVQCIWAGEVSVIVEVFKDKKLVEEKTLIFNSKNKDENNLWISKYYSGKIKSVGVLPYPREGLTVKDKKKYIKIVFDN